VIYLKVRVAAGGAIVSRAMRGLVRQGIRERQACLLIHLDQVKIVLTKRPFLYTFTIQQQLLSPSPGISSCHLGSPALFL